MLQNTHELGIGPTGGVHLGISVRADTSAVKLHRDDIIQELTKSPCTVSSGRQKWGEQSLLIAQTTDRQVRPLWEEEDASFAMYRSFE